MSSESGSNPVQIS